jgi:hypothetical protein
LAVLYGRRHQTLERRGVWRAGRRKGLIRRTPRSQRYQLTAFGRRTAVFFTKTHVRIVNASLAELDPHLPKRDRQPTAPRPRLAGVEHALDIKIKQAAIAA